jgi:hypothetical protein
VIFGNFIYGFDVLTVWWGESLDTVAHERDGGRGLQWNIGKVLVAVGRSKVRIAVKRSIYLPENFSL